MLRLVVTAAGFEGVMIGWDHVEGEGYKISGPVDPIAGAQEIEEARREDGCIWCVDAYGVPYLIPAVEITRGRVDDDGSIVTHRAQMALITSE